MNRRRFITSTAAALTGAAILPQVLSSTLSSIGTSQTALPYAFDALEPFFNARLLQEHFTLHHQPHVAALASPLTPKQGIVESIATHLNWMHRRLQNLRTATQHSGGARALAIRLCNIGKLVREHGGGHVNHSLFWRWMAPPNSAPRSPFGVLASSIDSTFGSFFEFKANFTRTALSILSEGWVWLVVRPDQSLLITVTCKEDNPLMRGIVPDEQLGLPILGIDMAAHAYALQYQDNPQGYINAWWQLVNWNQVAADYDHFADHAFLLAPPVHDELWGGNRHPN